MSGFQFMSIQNIGRDVALNTLLTMLARSTVADEAPVSRTVFSPLRRFRPYVSLMRFS
jgi:hypothetical protein